LRKKQRSEEKCQLLQKYINVVKTCADICKDEEELETEQSSFTEVPIKKTPVKQTPKAAKSLNKHSPAPYCTS